MQRSIHFLLTFVLIGSASPAGAALSASWLAVASADGSVGAVYPPAALANDPALNSMQTWDLGATYTAGDWASAGMRLVLPAGHFFYKHALGTNTRPNPAAFGTNPALEFTTYVSAAGDDGSNLATIVLTGYPEGDPISLGNATAPLPGQLSFSWGDLIFSPPGSYRILRITFPLGVLPGGLGQTSTHSPDETFIIDVPEPSGVAGALVVGAAMLFRAHRRPRIVAGSAPRCPPYGIAYNSI